MKPIFFVFLLITISVCSQVSKPQTSKEYQESLNIAFKDSLNSPLTKQDLQNFLGLDFFPIDSTFIVRAKFIKLENQKPFEMATTTSRKPQYIKYGELHFSISGKQFLLSVYQNVDLSQKKGFKDNLFLPFLDETNGIETYGGGRYLDLKIPISDSVIIDFNKAYNPYCAYNVNYSCPIVPQENELKIAIKAGVKKFHD